LYRYSEALKGLWDKGLIEKEEYLAGKAKVIENFATGNLQLSMSPASLPLGLDGGLEAIGALAGGVGGPGSDRAGGGGGDGGVQGTLSALPPPSTGR
jgi:hypothetical protein